MGIVAAVLSLFGGKKEAPKASDKLIPNQYQKAILDQVAYMFDRTNVTCMTYNLVPGDDGSMGFSVHVILAHDEPFIRGLHLEHQGGTCMQWHKPWDENEHGEEGKAAIGRSGVTFARTVAAVDIVLDSHWAIIDEFAIDLEAGDQLQFDGQYYWVAKK